MITSETRRPRLTSHDATSRSVHMDVSSAQSLSSKESISGVNYVQIRVTCASVRRVFRIYRRSKIGAMSKGLIIIIIGECKNPKYIKHV